MLNYDIWFIIFENSTLKTKTNLIQICEFLWDNFVISDLINIDSESKKSLNDSVLSLSIFEWVNNLNAKNNLKIKNVSFMKSLKVLHAQGNCGIDQEGINQLDLVELYTANNGKIKNVSFMKSLKVYH